MALSYITVKLGPGFRCTDTEQAMFNIECRLQFHGSTRKNKVLNFDTSLNWASGLRRVKDFPPQSLGTYAFPEVSSFNENLESLEECGMKSLEVKLVTFCWLNYTVITYSNESIPPKNCFFHSAFLHPLTSTCAVYTATYDMEFCVIGISDPVQLLRDVGDIYPTHICPFIKWFSTWTVWFTLINTKAIQLKQ